MDVRLPDGTVIRNVPEGTTRAQLAAKLGIQDQPAAPRETAGGMERFVRGMAEPVIGLGQAVSHGLAMLPVDALKENAQTYDDFTREYLNRSQQMAPEGFDVARTAGNIASPLNWAPAGKVAMMVPQAAGIGTRMAVQAPVGAALGLIQPAADFDAEKGGQVAAGAAAGAAGQGIASLAGKVIQPATAQAQELMRQGVKLTPGQTLGGVAKWLEDAATSVPVLGSMIQGARTRGLESFNVTAANRALAPIGETVPKTVKAGRDLINYTRQRLGDRYNNLLPQLQFRPDQQYAADLQGIIANTSSPAFVKAQQFQGIVNDKLFGKLQASNGNVTGEMFKEIEEGLGKEAKKYITAADPDQRNLGEALEQVLAATRQALMRSNPNQARELASINKGWANFTRLRGAASMLGAEEGVFTPAQLQNAVKSGSRAQFAGGHALMQDLSETGKSVLPSRLNESGTAPRLMTGAALTMGASAVEPNTLLAILAGSAAYTPVGQAAIRAALSRPQSANRLAELASQYGAVGAMPALAPLIYSGQ